MLPNRDTLESKEVTLADVVDMCGDCTALCTEKTKRVLENRSRSPRGWEKEYDEVAMKFQKDEYNKCFDACARVQRKCPESNAIRHRLGLPSEPVATLQKSKPNDSRPWWKVWGNVESKVGESSHSPIPSHSAMETMVVTEEELAVCENAAGDFSNVLFMLAHKPTKVQFHSYDPKTGDSYNPDTGEWITRNNKNQSSKDITAMLVDKWNAGLHGKQNITVLNPKDSDIDVTPPPHAAKRTDIPPQDPNVHGTVPRF